MSGVYQIYNSITGKRYIGSSINVEIRLKTHFNKLKNNKHINQHLQNAWNKYEKFLVFEFLEECEPDECLIFEQYYLDYYKSYNREFGYNIDPDAKYAGKRLSQETRDKIRLKVLGRRPSREAIEKTRKANTGQKRPTQSEKMRNRWDISKTYFGYNNLSEDKQKIVAKKISLKNIERYKDFKNKRNNIFLKVTFDSNDILYFNSYRNAANILNIDKGTISHALTYTNGRVYKLNAIFEKISKEEYIKSISL